MAGTVIGEGLSIEGDLTSDEEVVVHGTVRGKLTTSEAVTVGGTGSVGPVGIGSVVIAAAPPA